MGMEISQLTKDDLYEALRRSCELQSHYAGLLNQYDGGERQKFTTPEAWISRLRETGGLPKLPPPDSWTGCDFKDAEQHRSRVLTGSIGLEGAWSEWENGRPKSLPMNRQFEYRKKAEVAP
jgi:hypothetical protein